MRQILSVRKGAMAALDRVRYGLLSLTFVGFRRGQISPGLNNLQIDVAELEGF